MPEGVHAMHAVMRHSHAGMRHRAVQTALHSTVQQLTEPSMGGSGQNRVWGAPVWGAVDKTGPCMGGSGQDRALYGGALYGGALYGGKWLCCAMRHKGVRTGLQ